MRWFKRPPPSPSQEPSPPSPITIEPVVDGRVIRLRVTNAGPAVQCTALVTEVRDCAEPIARRTWPLPWDASRGNYRDIAANGRALLDFAECPAPRPSGADAVLRGWIWCVSTTAPERFRVWLPGFGSAADIARRRITVVVQVSTLEPKHEVQRAFEVGFDEALKAYIAPAGSFGS